MAGKKSKVSSGDLATLAGLMEILLKSGVPVLEAMDITVKRLSNKALGAAFKEGAKEIKSGRGLTQTLKKYPKLFPAEFVALLEIGENKGVIDVMFEKLALFYAQDYAFARGYLGLWVSGCAWVAGGAGKGVRLLLLNLA